MYECLILKVLYTMNIFVFDVIPCKQNKVSLVIGCDELSLGLAITADPMHCGRPMLSCGDHDFRAFFLTLCVKTAKGSFYCPLCSVSLSFAEMCLVFCAQLSNDV